jgi:high-affinity nickel permease
LREEKTADERKTIVDRMMEILGAVVGFAMGALGFVAATGIVLYGINAIQTEGAVVCAILLIFGGCFAVCAVLFVLIAVDALRG